MKYMLAAALVIAAVSAASAQSPQPSVQQQFDAASTALGDEDWAEALRLYDALEARVRNNPRSLAIVRIRKAEALARLRRYAEADEAIRLGLPQLSAEDPSLAEDRLRAARTSGIIAELSLDFAEAARRYRAGLGIDGPVALRLALHRGLIQSLIFSDRDAALQSADEALRIVETLPDNRRLRGQFKTLRGRALLNLGRHAEARTELFEAVRLLGGMTTRVDAADIAARSDLALSALLLGDAATARRYLAMTGAGRFRTGALEPLGNNRPPACRNGLTPEDVVVVEFSVAPDGSVLQASPIYATSAAAAREMPLAVQSWFFLPAQLAQLHPLFRALARVEVRCSRLENRPILWRVVTARDGPNAQPPRAQLAADLRAALARLDAAPTSNREEVMALLLALATHPAVEGEEATTYDRRALEMVRNESDDPMIIAEFVLFLSRTDRTVSPGANADDAARALTHPLVRERPDVAAALHYMIARVQYYLDRYAEALAEIERMKAASGASLHPSFRADALALEAAIHAARGETEAARAAWLAIGPTAARCGPTPRTVSIPGRSADFPDEALRWGFEGWAFADAAIRPDGTVAETRRVIAYPPFVFGEAAERVIARSRYERNFTSDGRPCFGHMQRVVFRLPD